jgi:Domain of unknown function (DUF4148)
VFKTVIPAALIASFLVVPTFAFSQSNGQVTRAEVQAELAQLEQAGYLPMSDRKTYPNGVISAEQRVVAQRIGSTSSYGGSAAGSNASGLRVDTTQTLRGADADLYSRH